MAIYLHNKNIKFISLGAWLTNNNAANNLRVYLAKKHHSNIFYTYESKKYFIKEGVNEEKLFF